MTTKPKTIRLPDKSELLRRLRSPDTTPLDNEVYDHLAEHADQPVDGAGLVAIVHQALATIQEREPNAYWPRAKLLFVIASIVDDAEVRIDANLAVT